MKCPFCRATTTDVFNTRSTRFSAQIWRRRRCLSCHKAFTTYEAPDLSFLRVSTPARRQTTPYSRSKLFSGVYQAFLDLPDKAGTIDAVTDTIEAKLLDLKLETITTAQISTIVLTTLKHFDTAAFLRYLSSHAQLTTKTNLKNELKKY